MRANYSEQNKGWKQTRAARVRRRGMRNVADGSRRRRRREHFFLAFKNNIARSIFPWLRGRRRRANMRRFRGTVTSACWAGFDVSPGCERRETNRFVYRGGKNQFRFVYTINSRVSLKGSRIDRITYVVRVARIATTNDTGRLQQTGSAKRSGVEVVETTG